MRNTSVTAAISADLFARRQAAAQDLRISKSSLVELAIRLLLRHSPEQLENIISKEWKKHE